MCQKYDISVPGYQVAADKIRPGGVRGRGVLLLMKDHLQVKECDALNSLKFEESAWCIVNTSPACRLLVGICYRSPSSTFENNQELLRLMDALMTTCATDYLIMGDFNFREINWIDGSAAGPKGLKYSSVLLFMISDCYLSQHITFHARYRDGMSPSTPDLVFTDQENNVENL